MTKIKTDYTLLLRIKLHIPVVQIPIRHQACLTEKCFCSRKIWKSSRISDHVITKTHKKAILFGRVRFYLRKKYKLR